MKKEEYIAPALGWRAVGAGLFCASLGVPASQDDDFESFTVHEDSDWDAGW